MNIGFYRECTNPRCKFRYPDLDSSSLTGYCPKCGGNAPITSKVSFSKKSNFKHKHHLEIIPMLDNLRSVYNVGSIIRTCEGFGIQEIILSGITPSPDHPRMNKTSLGSIPSIKWQSINNGLNKIIKLKESGFQIISLEGIENTLPIYQVNKDLLGKHICLVVGNENLGIDPGILKISDLIIAIPMSGMKESFNVSVAFGIAAYHFSMVAKA